MRLEMVGHVLLACSYLTDRINDSPPPPRRDTLLAAARRDLQATSSLFSGVPAGAEGRRHVAPRRHDKPQKNVQSA